MLGASEPLGAGQRDVDSFGGQRGVARTCASSLSFRSVMRGGFYARRANNRGPVDLNDWEYLYYLDNYPRLQKVARLTDCR